MMNMNMMNKIELDREFLANEMFKICICTVPEASAAEIWEAIAGTTDEELLEEYLKRV